MEELRAAAIDSNCLNAKECSAELGRRSEESFFRTRSREMARAELLENPFNPRTEVSADARHTAGRIITHMWIIFIVLPFILAILFAIFTAK